MLHPKYERWKKTRELGEIRFILKYGVLGTFLIGTTIVAGSKAYFELNTLNNIGLWVYLTSSHFLQFVIIASVLFSTAGIINGKFLWWLNEKEYNKAVKELENLQKGKGAK